MRISFKRVFSGGLVAALVIVLSGACMVPVIGKEMERALSARNLAPMGVGAMIYFTIVSVTLGIADVALYAAIVPRFGLGAKTAIIAAISIWFLAYFLANVSMVAYGFMPIRLTVIGTAWGLVEISIASLVGTRFYRDYDVSSLSGQVRAKGA